jgi:23S rRNA (cytidine2498-2'-O)-methyltransferase
MHVFLSAEESRVHLLAELRRLAPQAGHELLPEPQDASAPPEPQTTAPRRTAGAPRRIEDRPRKNPPAHPSPGDVPEPPGLILSDLELSSGAAPILAFARQTLPDASEAQRESIKAWADLLFQSVMDRLPEDQPWQLHVTPHYGGQGAGSHRCDLILSGVRERLQKRRRQRLRHWTPPGSAFTPTASLIQLALTAPDRGWLSIASAPLPHQLRAIVSPFPAGDIPVASDKAAPCRAFAKLVEALQRLGRTIQPGETCVDLGACPGSWSYVALRSGAQVIAVDRSPLREDLMRDPRLEFRRGDAFAFVPERPVDWLLCDVIASPSRSIELVHDWVKRRLARRFVVTIKFKGTTDYAALDTLKATLPALCREFRLTRLCANRNEACVFGEVGETGP